MSGLYLVQSLHIPVFTLHVRALPSTILTYSCLYFTCQGFTLYNPYIFLSLLYMSGLYIQYLYNPYIFLSLHYMSGLYLQYLYNSCFTIHGQGFTSLYIFLLYYTCSGLYISLHIHPCLCVHSSHHVRSTLIVHVVLLVEITEGWRSAWAVDAQVKGVGAVALVRHVFLFGWDRRYHFLRLLTSSTLVTVDVCAFQRPFVLFHSPVAPPLAMLYLNGLVHLLHWSWFLELVLGLARMWAWPNSLSICPSVYEQFVIYSPHTVEFPGT